MPKSSAFDTFTVTEGEVFVLRAPAPYPIRTSFGIMTDRPAVLVRLVDDAGHVGWGEIWCNFPSVGAEHRARLVESVLLPLLTGRAVSDPAEAWAFLTKRTHTLVLQSGEQGPFAHAISGIDTALWDIAAKRAGVPLWRFLGGAGAASVPAYASGINPEAPERTVADGRAHGYRAFKLKIGFGREIDVANVARVREVIGPDVPFMVDANQAWSLEEAIEMARALEPFGLNWLEEPLATDRPLSEWQALAKATTLPLAAGENLRGADAFDAAIQSGAFAVVQPDLAKWGGISGTLPVARAIRAAGLRYCPHFLGASVGLLASAHLLKAVGGDGLLEIDANENELRTALTHSFPTVVDGNVALPEGPGLGIDPREDILARHRRM